MELLPAVTDPCTSDDVTTEVLLELTDNETASCVARLLLSDKLEDRHIQSLHSKEQTEHRLQKVKKNKISVIRDSPLMQRDLS